VTSLRKWKLADRAVSLVLYIAFAVVLAAGLSSLAGGCAAQSQSPQWPPDVEFKSAAVSGSLELATPAGPLTVDLSTGLVFGGDAAAGVYASRVNLEVNAEFAIAGLGQVVAVSSPGRRLAEGWAQCVELRSSTEVTPGLVVDLVARPPGLPTGCGGSLLEVSTRGAWGNARDDPDATTQAE
jgi:hypothetical protein